jgi:hypothetical protein
MTNPLIQIDDEVREMTQEEYETYLEQVGEESAKPEAEAE